MKNIKFFGLLSIAALAISVSSCTNDNEPVISENETGNNTESGVFTIKANIGELQQTRATVKPEDGKSFTWIKGDKFDLYQNSDWAKKEFSIDDTSIGNDGKSADFNCSEFEPASDATYYAFYPQGFTTDNTAFTYTIPDEVYTQTGDNNTDHLKDGMIMIATGSSADIQNSVTFEHKTALFRFGISNLKSEAVTVNSIKLSSTDLECFAKQYTYNIGDTETVGSKSTELNLNFGKGVTLAAKGSEGNVMKAYTLAIPADAIAEGETETFTLTVTYNDNSTIENKIELINKTIDGEKINQSFEPGKVYTFNIDIDYNRYYITGNYNGWSWENCQYIYDTNLDGIYEGMIYLNSKGTDDLYEYKITQYKNWIKEWNENNDNFKMGTNSCIVQVKPEYEGDKVYRWDYVSIWGVVGDFNDWGKDKSDAVMMYKFEGNEHCLVAENVVIGDASTWKIRPDYSWPNRGDEEGSLIQINSDSKVVIEGDAKMANDYDKNFVVTAGAGTYEFKWYFNLPQPKIVVTKE